MNRRNLVELWKSMDQHKGIRSVKLAYFIAKNKKRIQPEIEALEKALAPSEDFQTYDNKRAKLAEFYSDKDPNGNPVIQNNNYMINEKLSDFNKEVDKLKEECKNAIEEREKQVEDYNKMLDEDFEFDGHKIQLDSLPNEIDSVFIEILMDNNLLDD